MSTDKETHLDKHETEEFLGVLHELHGKRFTLYREEWDLAGSQKHVPEFPLHLELEINNCCNLKCKMCHFSKFEHSIDEKKNMSLDLVDRILTECRGKLSAVLIGSGAESLLHPDVEGIFRRFHEAGIMDIILSTNGVLLNRELSRLLIELQVARVTISLDAVTEDVYRRIRGGSLAKVEKNILAFLEEKQKAGSALPYLRATFVTQEENQHEADAFRKKWLGKADRVDLQKLIKVRELEQGDSPLPVPEGNSCAQPFQRLTVDYNGDVFPCCSYYKKHLKLGNLNAHTLEELWNSPKMQGLRDSLVRRDFAPACKACLRY